MAEQDSSRTEEVHCRECGKVVEQGPTRRGRKRLWCSEECKKAGKYKYHLENKHRWPFRRVNKTDSTWAEINGKRIISPAKKICVVCASAFKGFSSAKYCSDECKRDGGPKKQRRERGPFVCKNCGKEYTTRCRQGEGEDYCSRSCAFDDIKRWNPGPKPIPKTMLPRYTRMKPCDECGTYLVKYADGRRICLSCKSAKEQARKQAQCKHCGAEFVRKVSNQYYCTDMCRSKAYKETRKRGAAASRKKRGSGRSRSRAKYYGVPYEYINVTKVFERDGWRCQICGVSTPKSRRGTKHANAPELDHRIPLSKGGGHLYSNVQCACKACNAAKGNKTEIGQQPLYTWDDLAA